LADKDIRNADDIPDVSLREVALQITSRMIMASMEGEQLYVGICGCCYDEDETVIWLADGEPETDCYACGNKVKLARVTPLRKQRIREAHPIERWIGKDLEGLFYLFMEGLLPEGNPPVPGAGSQ
jgi:Zn ribbon nucleic-acid-binding protein